MTTEMGTAPIVEAYVDAVHRRDARAMVGLFAPGGQLNHPVGTFTGAEEIGGFYRDVVFAGGTRIQVGAVLSEQGIVIAELAATSELAPDSGTAYAVDVFRLDGEGRIEQLDIYYR